DMLPEAYRARAKAAIDQALSTGRVTDYVTKASITPQNPAGKWYACRVSPYWTDGGIAGAVIAGHETSRPSGEA
ncbi:MAG TPA: PAS domain-containing protein, partial [Candidatus Binatia bacterium]|nr:PAS domain-containing protein [Candidatus Binatia bacterium]